MTELRNAAGGVVQVAQRVSEEEAGSGVLGAWMLNDRIALGTLRR